MSRISSRKAKYYYDEPFAEAAARQKQRNARRYFETSFHCQHCGALVNTDPLMSGVNNRNHCPYCLHSRHLDLYESGDRLCACRGTMQPIGATTKQSRNKYAKQAGELMLVHQCVACGSFSINRIAADDIAEGVFECFQQSFLLDDKVVNKLLAQGIILLGKNDRPLVEMRLFGRSKEIIME
jgi:DNA-directed RNA polymerase subunit RPC12/RpoP